MIFNELEDFLELIKISGISEVYLKNELKISDDNDLLVSFYQKIKNCQKCPLANQRTSFVFGEGNPQADLMIIGEAPGAQEDKHGKPFIGPAGQLLTKMLQAINIDRKDIFITNVVKCHPPHNRNPLPMETNACRPYLDEQIKIINPKVIVMMGLVAARTLLEMNKSLKSFRQETYSFNGIKTFVTYHPSALLRNPQWKRPAWVDLQNIQKYYEKIGGNK